MINSINSINSSSSCCCINGGGACHSSTVVFAVELGLVEVGL